MCLLNVKDGLESYFAIFDTSPDMSRCEHLSEAGFFFFFLINSVLLKMCSLTEKSQLTLVWLFILEKEKGTLHLINSFSFKHPTVGSKAVHHDGDMRTYVFILTRWHSSCFRKMDRGLSSECIPVCDLTIFLFIGNFCFFLFI